MEEQGRGGEDNEDEESKIEEFKEEVQELRYAMTAMKRQLDIAMAACARLIALIEDTATTAIATITSTTSSSGTTTGASSQVPPRRIPRRGKRKRSTLTPSPPDVVPSPVREWGILDIGEEILWRICAYLNVNDLCCLSLVCRQIRAVTDRQPWKKIFREQIGSLKRFRKYPENLRSDYQFWKQRYLNERVLAYKWTKAGPREKKLLVGHSKKIESIQFIDNRLISCDENLIREWNLLTGATVISLANDDKVNKIHHFRCNQKKMVISHSDAVRVYDSNTMDFLFCLNDYKGQTFSYANRLRMYDNLIVAGLWDGYIRVWQDDGTSVIVLTGHNSPIYCIDMTKEWIASGSSDRCIKLWNLSQKEAILTLKGHGMTVSSLQMHEWTQTLFAGSRDQCVYHWDIRSGRLIHKFESHSKPVSSVQVDDNRLVTCSLDGTIKIWDQRTFNRVAEPLVPKPGVGITCMQFSHNHLVAGLNDGTVIIYDY